MGLPSASLKTDLVLAALLAATAPPACSFPSDRRRAIYQRTFPATTRCQWHHRLHESPGQLQRQCLRRIFFLHPKLKHICRHDYADHDQTRRQTFEWIEAFTTSVADILQSDISPRLTAKPKSTETPLRPSLHFKGNLILISATFASPRQNKTWLLKA